MSIVGSQSPASAAPAEFGASIEMTHDQLVAGGWKDDSLDAITAVTKLGQGDAIADSSGKFHKVALIVEPDAKYMIEPLGG